MHITSTFNYVFYEILYVDILKAGCCKPQIICQIQYMKVTFWGKQNIAVDSSYPYNNYFDTWTNDQSMLQLQLLKRRICEDITGQMMDTWVLPGCDGFSTHCFSFIAMLEH